MAIALVGDHVVCEPCVVAESFAARLRGLLGRRALPAREGMLIRRESSVHTFFMRFAIDVVFLDRSDRVLKVAPTMKPWRMTSCRKARAALELPAGEASRRGLTPGMSLTRIWPKSAV